jgi:hypothetical protein
VAVEPLKLGAGPVAIPAVRKLFLELLEKLHRGFFIGVVPGVPIEFGVQQAAVK